MCPKIRVLFVSHSGEWGGAQKCLFLLLEALDRARFDPVVVVPSEGDFAEKACSLGIATHTFPFGWLAGAIGSRGAIAPRYRAGLPARIEGLVALLCQEKIDVVFTNTAVIGESAQAAARCGLPHIWYVHELLSRNPDLEPLIDLPELYAFMDRFSNRVVAVSQAVKRELSPFVRRSKLAVIRPGLSPGTPPASGRSAAPVIGFVGVFSRGKGVLHLVNAAPSILRHHPQARFLLLGTDCGTLAGVRRRITALGMDSAFDILPFRNDPSDIFATIDLLVVPSLAESFSLVILEAMAAAKPVVATRSGGPQEIIADGRTGLLVPPGNPHALAQAVVRLLDDPKTMRQMGTLGAKRLAEIFRQDSYARTFDELIAGVVAAHRRQPASARRRLQAARARNDLMTLL